MPIRRTAAHVEQTQARAQARREAALNLSVQHTEDPPYAKLSLAERTLIPYVRNGQVSNEPWVIENAERCSEPFMHFGLKTCAVICAATDRYAADTITQFPALIPMILQQRDSTHSEIRNDILFRASLTFPARPKLKTLAAQWHISPVLRKIHPQLLEPYVASVLAALTEHLSPSDLSNALDRFNTVRSQYDWLAGLRVWCRQAITGHEFRWAALNMDEPERAIEVIDYLTQSSPEDRARLIRGSYVRAGREAADWHRILQFHGVDVALDSTQFSEPDLRVADYGPLVDVWTHETDTGTYVFKALKTLEALQEESRTMRHCVDTYWPRVVGGDCSIYSVSFNGKRVATLELDPVPKTQFALSGWRQAKGPRNTRLADHVINVINEFVRIGAYE